jgi:V-type H+-transporting ATPase subunit C
MSFYYISAPYLLNNREATIKEIRDSIIGRKLASAGGELNLKKVNFKMANLDTLMFCNDKALKLETVVESLLKKIDKQFCDLAEKATHEWWVKGEKEIPVKKYVSDFSWNQSKYPFSSPIPVVFAEFERALHNIENMLRADTNRYNEAKVQLNALAQKEYLISHPGAILTSATSLTW